MQTFVSFVVKLKNPIMKTILQQIAAKTRQQEKAEAEAAEMRENGTFKGGQTTVAVFSKKLLSEALHSAE